MYKDKSIDELKNTNLVYQATTQFIRKDWVKRVIPLNKQFMNDYYDNGGTKVLNSL